MRSQHFLKTLVVCLALVMGLSFSEGAYARGPFSALTVDARTGQILYSKDIDGKRHPASLTKMMTLYLIFQDLKSGKIDLDTPLTVSNRAARMAPSKLGVRPGNQITVENAIKALIIKSANDVAATVAENLGGTEGAFAARMTSTARSMGMTKTTYVNASGLPNPAQITTARDQATLGLRLMRDFPQYYPYFRARGFVYRGRYIGTHNFLVGRFNGTDGIKTGYINASGYNLVTSTKRGDKRLVGVVIGGRTAGQRNAYMVSMINSNFARAKSGQTIAALAGSSSGAINPLASAASNPVAVKNPSTSDKAQLAAAAESAALEEHAQQASEDSSLTQDESPKVLEAQLADQGDGNSDEDMETASIGEQWDIQIGDFKTKKAAKQNIAHLKSGKELAGKDMLTETVEFGGTVTYKARVVGFTEETAKAACEVIVKSGLSCEPVAPQS